MKLFKKTLVALIAAMIMVMGLSVVSFAASSPVKTNISTADVNIKKVKYNGAKCMPSVKVTAADGTRLKEGVDYVVEFKATKHSGDHVVVIRGIGRYEGTTTGIFTIDGTANTAENKVTVKAQKTQLKASSMKKKSSKVKLTVSKSKKNKGKVTYKVVTKGNKNAAKYVSVNSKGVVKFKKGIKKGTYKVKIMVAGYKKFDPQVKTVKFVIK